MMGSHLTLCKNSGNITPSSNTCTQTKICPSSWLYPFLKLSDTLVFTFYIPFGTLSPSLRFLPDVLSFISQNLTVLQQHTIKSRNSHMPTFLSSGTPPTIICWAVDFANVRLLGKRGVFECFRTTCMLYVASHWDLYIQCSPEVSVPSWFT